MRIKSLAISNFRAIERFEIDNLGDFIVIAGPNGCGKSTVLDALRLIKSVYVPNEWNRWFNEFGINLERPANFSTLFRNPALPLTIEAVFVLHDSERTFLQTHATNIALGLALNSELRASTTITGERPLEPPTLSPAQLEAIRVHAAGTAKVLLSELGNPQFTAAVTMTKEPRIDVAVSATANAAFSCFSPESLGEIEFHGSRRYYARESVNNIRLNLGDRSEERRNRFLYDLENKYKNIKTQLSEEYIASILKRSDPQSGPLQQSIKELFKTFFPGKEFLGVQVGDHNAMLFPVRLSTGEVHDIDELSSGEKEIVYGYLWLRTGTPRRSIVLIDEPELHLNPALVQGLAAFYKSHIADALNAQVWIVTHSDAILRQAVRGTQTAVYHMARARGDGTQQAVHIDSQNAVEAAVLELVGNLAAYRPYAKIVLVEGHKDTRFDVDMIGRLFPDLAEKGNFIPVGNRRMTTGVRVRLLEVLTETGLTGRAVSISDGDLRLSGSSAEGDATHFIWPVYEIENFLLVPNLLREAAKLLLGRDPFKDDEEVIEKLKNVAGALLPELALDEVQYGLNRQFVMSLSIGGSKKAPKDDLIKSTTATKARLNAIDVSDARIAALLDQATTRFRQHLTSLDFLIHFPGDRLMRALAGQLGINGDHYRNACLDQAQRTGLRPPGMERTLLDALR